MHCDKALQCLYINKTPVSDIGKLSLYGNDLKPFSDVFIFLEIKLGMLLQYDNTNMLSEKHFGFT
jgi:hypothetical protein